MNNERTRDFYWTYLKVKEHFFSISKCALVALAVTVALRVTVSVLILIVNMVSHAPVTGITVLTFFGALTALLLNEYK